MVHFYVATLRGLAIERLQPAKRRDADAAVGLLRRTMLACAEPYADAPARPVRSGTGL